MVLTIWREIERQLLEVGPGSPEEEELHADALRLRDEYQRLVQLAIAHERPLPPPFPASQREHGQPAGVRVGS